MVCPLPTSVSCLSSVMTGLREALCYLSSRKVLRWLLARETWPCHNPFPVPHRVTATLPPELKAGVGFLKK